MDGIGGVFMRYWLGREGDDKRGPRTKVRLNIDCTVVTLNNTISDSQPKACSLASLFRCEERFKNVGKVFCANADTRIADNNVHVLAIRGLLQLQRQSPSFRHCFHSIDLKGHEC